MLQEVVPIQPEPRGQFSGGADKPPSASNHPDFQPSTGVLQDIRDSVATREQKAYTPELAANYASLSGAKPGHRAGLPRWLIDSREVGAPHLQAFGLLSCSTTNTPTPDRPSTRPFALSHCMALRTTVIDTS